MNEVLICITSHPLGSPSLVNKLHTALQANLQSMDVDQKSPTSSQHADTTMMVSTVITFHLTFSASRLSQKEDCLLHNSQYMLHPITKHCELRVSQPCSCRMLHRALQGGQAATRPSSSQGCPCHPCLRYQRPPRAQCSVPSAVARRDAVGSVHMPAL